MTAVEKDANDWFERSEYDFDTAQDMFRLGRYSYALFCAQQAVEKRLKGLYVLHELKMPRRTHKLLKLAADLGIEISPHHELLFKDLNKFYGETRYPSEMGDARIGDKTEFENILDKTRGVLVWL